MSTRKPSRCCANSRSANDSIGAHGETGYRADLDLVFCRPGGSAEDPNVIGRRFARRVRKLATVPQIGLHGLRHTHATLLLEAGVFVNTVSEEMDHLSLHDTLPI